MQKRFNKIGFTLSEILITLGIIGVIAAVTIPSLVQGIQDAQFKAAWKKPLADSLRQEDDLGRSWRKFVGCFRE